MAEDINRFTATGRVAQEPRLAVTASGVDVLEWSIAVHEAHRDASGQWAETASFVPCLIFAHRATALAGIMRQGMKVAVDGRIRQRKWTGRDGRQESKLELVVDHVTLPDRSSGERPGVTGASTGEQAAAATMTKLAADVAADEEIPF